MLVYQSVYTTNNKGLGYCSLNHTLLRYNPLPLLRPCLLRNVPRRQRLGHACAFGMTDITGILWQSMPHGEHVDIWESTYQDPWK